MYRICILSLALGLALTLGAQADELADAGRAVFEANQSAIISVRAVLSLNYGGGEEEDEREANATVVAEDGLCVLSLTAIDPTVMMQRLGGSEAEIVSKVRVLKLILPDGSETDAQVVLRDRDLDLVFLRPVEKPAAPMAHVDLEKLGDPQLLDNVLFIAQMGKVARRVHTAFLERILGVVDRPMKFYLVGEDRSQAVACSPCFTLDGGFVGIGVLRAIRSTSAGSMGDNPIVIIVSAQDIKSAMSQVPAWGEAIPETPEDAGSDDAPADDAAADDAAPEAPETGDETGAV